jgi:hydrogenase maturation protease
MSLTQRARLLRRSFATSHTDMDLVVGVGNELRSDDGVGVRIVRALPERSDVETVVVHQLTFDLAETLARARRVLFVDAHARETRMQLARVSRHEMGPGIGHALEPEALLAWTSAACGQAPEAWVLSVPAQSFEVGEQLSPDVERAVPAARRAVLDWLEGPVPRQE